MASPHEILNTIMRHRSIIFVLWSFCNEDVGSFSSITGRHVIRNVIWSEVGGRPAELAIA